MRKHVLVFIVLNFFVCESWSQNQEIGYLAGLLESGNFVKLKVECERNISASSKNRAAHYYLGIVFYETNEFRQAVEHLDLACKLKPDADVYYRLALAYGSLAETVNTLKQPFVINDMVNALEKALSFDTNHNEAKFLLAKFYTSAPSFLGGDLEKAKKYSNELMSVRPEYANLVKGYIFMKEENASSAEDYFLKALEINPSLDDAYDKLNTLCSTKGNFSTYLIKLTSLHPFSPCPFYYLALTQMDNQQYSEASRNFLRAISNDPEFMPAYYQAGKLSVISHTGYEIGIRYLNKYLSKPVGKRNIIPSHADAHWRLGMIYEELKNKNEAISHYELAISLDPDHDAAKQALKKISN